MATTEPDDAIDLMVDPDEAFDLVSDEDDKEPPKKNGITKPSSQTKAGFSPVKDCIYDEKVEETTENRDDANKYKADDDLAEKPVKPPREVLPENIQSFVDRRLCLWKLEFGTCKFSDAKCDYAHGIEPVDILLFIDVLRNAKDRELPVYLRSKVFHDSKIDRLRKLYTKQQTVLAGKKLDCLTALIQIAETTQTSAIDHKSDPEVVYTDWAKTAKFLILEVYVLYYKVIPEQFQTGVGDDELQKLNILLGILIDLAHCISSRLEGETSTALKLAWDTLSFVMSSGLTLPIHKVLGLWDIFLNGDDNLRLLHFVNYLSVFPGYKLADAQRLNCTFKKLIVGQLDANCQDYVEIMFPTLLNIEKDLALQMELDVIQDILDKCLEHHKKSEDIESVIRLLRSFEIPGLQRLPEDDFFDESSGPSMTLQWQAYLKHTLDMGNWDDVAEKIAELEPDDIFDMSDAFKRIFESIVSNFGDVKDMTDNAFKRLVEAMIKRNKGRPLLPIQKALLSQFAASMIFHFANAEGPSGSLETVVTCMSWNMRFDPWFCTTYYDPLSYSNAASLRAHHLPHEVVMAGVVSCLVKPEFVMWGYELFRQNRAGICQNFPKDTVFRLARDIFHALLEQLPKPLDQPEPKAVKFLFMEHLLPLKCNPEETNFVSTEERDNLENDVLNVVIDKLLACLVSGPRDPHCLEDVLPFVTSYENIGRRSNSNIRVLAHHCQEHKKLMEAWHFFTIGKERGIYPESVLVETVPDDGKENGKDPNKGLNGINVECHFSMFELELILTDTLNAIGKNLGQSAVENLKTRCDYDDIEDCYFFDSRTLGFRYLEAEEDKALRFLIRPVLPNSKEKKCLNSSRVPTKEDALLNIETVLTTRLDPPIETLRVNLGAAHFEQALPSKPCPKSKKPDAERSQKKKDIVLILMPKDLILHCHKEIFDIKEWE